MIWEHWLDAYLYLYRMYTCRSESLVVSVLNIYNIYCVQSYCTSCHIGPKASIVKQYPISLSFRITACRQFAWLGLTDKQVCMGQCWVHSCASWMSTDTSHLNGTLAYRCAWPAGLAWVVCDSVFVYSRLWSREITGFGCSRIDSTKLSSRPVITNVTDRWEWGQWADME